LSLFIHYGRVWEGRSENAFMLGFRTRGGRAVSRAIVPLTVKKQSRIFGNQNMAAKRNMVALKGNRSC